MKRSVVAAALFGSSAVAQSGAWEQCGGIGWTGATSCVSGYYCIDYNDYYYQCIPGTASSSAASTSAPPKTSTTMAKTSTTMATTSAPIKTTTATSSAPVTSTSSPGGDDEGFEWFGINESVAEFGSGIYPGVYGTDYYFPDTDTIGELMSEGYNIFRICFAMERMAVGSLTADLDPYYLGNISNVATYITGKGGYAVLDAHNYGRYNGVIINDTSAFGSFWSKMATHFVSDSNVIFDTNNEYHDMDQTLVLDLNQAAITSIRAAGATTQYIFVEGNSYTGAWTWTEVNTNLVALTDPSDMIIYEMHQYLDSDGSGTNATCVNSTIGSSRVSDATGWLRANGKLGILGEYAGGPNTICMDAITDMLNYMEDNSDVWKGAMWWAAGPWWGDYMFSYEPPSGEAYEYYDSTLKNYVVS